MFSFWSSISQSANSSRTVLFLMTMLPTSFHDLATVITACHVVLSTSNFKSHIAAAHPSPPPTTPPPAPARFSASRRRPCRRSTVLMPMLLLSLLLAVLLPPYVLPLRVVIVAKQNDNEEGMTIEDEHQQWSMAWPTLVEKEIELVNISRYRGHQNHSPVKFKGDVYVVDTNEMLRKRKSVFAAMNVNGWPVCLGHAVCVYAKPQLNYDKDRPEPHVEAMPNMASARVLPPFGAMVNGRSWSDVKCIPEHDFMDNENNSTTPVTTTPTTLWIKGRTLLIDTYAFEPHFGHVGAKAVQTRSFLLALTRLGLPAPNRVLFFQQNRYPTENRVGRSSNSTLARIVLTALGAFSSPQRSIYRSDIEQMNHGRICFEDTIEIKNIYERKFLHANDIWEWKRLASLEKHLSSKTHAMLMRKCLGQGLGVVVLQRGEGWGKRSILNYDTLTRALRRVGISSYRNVTVDSTDSFEHQIKLFAGGFALMLASHSSQLLNLIWSHPQSAVLELRPDGGEDGRRKWFRYPSPFCVDWDCNVIFNVSIGHSESEVRFDRFKKNEELKKRNAKWLTKPLLVDEDRLVKDLTGVLERQRKVMLGDGCDVTGLYGPPPVPDATE